VFLKHSPVIELCTIWQAVLYPDNRTALHLSNITPFISISTGWPLHILPRGGVVVVLLVLQRFVLTTCMLLGLPVTWECVRLNRTPLRLTDINVLTPDPLAGFHITLPVVVGTVYWFHSLSLLVIFSEMALFIIIISCTAYYRPWPPQLRFSTGFALVPYFSIIGFQELSDLVPHCQAT
jgi:hypothetical protein